jgi:hypothetical protein
MPCDYANYPADWKTEIRPAILRRAMDCCEWCGVANHLIMTRHKRPAAVYRALAWGDAAVLASPQPISTEHGEVTGVGPADEWSKPIRVVLTIAH